MLIGASVAANARSGLQRGPHTSMPSSGWPGESVPGVVISRRWQTPTFSQQAEQAAHLLTADGQIDDTDPDISWENTNIGGGRGWVHVVPDPEGVFPGCVRNTCVMLETYTITGQSGSFVAGDRVEFRNGGTPTCSGEYVGLEGSDFKVWIYNGQTRPSIGNTINNLDRAGSGTVNANPTTASLGPGNYGTFDLTATDRVWYRCFYRWSPGWTTVGPNPTGHANSRKLCFLTWAGGIGARQEIEYSNTDERIVGFSQTGTSFTEANWATNTHASLLGDESVGDEWDDGDWREVVAYYEKLSSTTARWALFWRKATLNGAWLNMTFAQARQYCIDQGGNFQNATQNLYDFNLMGQNLTNASSAPAQCAGGNTNANRNKHGHTSEMYEYYAGLDVSTAADPFGLLSLLTL